MTLEEKCVKWLPILFLTLLMSVNTFAQTDKAEGKPIFEKHCVRCHGNDGKKGKWKAKDLTLSRMSDKDILQLIKEGKKRMPSYNKKLSDEEMKAVIAYLKRLRK